MSRDITIIIKTFDRLECLSSLLSSIRDMDLKYPIIIADDSKTSYNEIIQNKFSGLAIKYIDLPYDTGASFGRNILVRSVDTKYLVLCDDDFIFDKRTDLALMQQLIAESDVELLGATVYNRTLLIADENYELIKNLVKLKPRTSWHILLWRIYHNPVYRNLFNFVFTKEHEWDFYGNFTIDNGTCFLYPLSDNDYRAPYTKCDFVPQFFLAKTSSLKNKGVYWDEDIKYYGEHLDFFIRAKSKSLIVAYTKEVGVIHQRIHNKSIRCAVDSRPIMMRKNGLHDIKLVTN